MLNRWLRHVLPQVLAEAGYPPHQLHESAIFHVEVRFFFDNYRNIGGARDPVDLARSADASSLDEPGFC